MIWIFRNSRGGAAVALQISVARKIAQFSLVNYLKKQNSQIWIVLQPYYYYWFLHIQISVYFWQLPGLIPAIFLASF